MGGGVLYTCSLEKGLKLAVRKIWPVDRKAHGIKVFFGGCLMIFFAGSHKESRIKRSVVRGQDISSDKGMSEGLRPVHGPERCKRMV